MSPCVMMSLAVLTRGWARRRRLPDVVIDDQLDGVSGSLIRASIVTAPGVTPSRVASRSGDPRLNLSAPMLAATCLRSTAFSHSVTSSQCRWPFLSRRKRFLVWAAGITVRARSASSQVNTGA